MALWIPTFSFRSIISRVDETLTIFHLSHIRPAGESKYSIGTVLSVSVGEKIDGFDTIQIRSYWLPQSAGNKSLCK